MADLLEQDRVFQRTGNLTQSLERSGEVAIAVSLYGLLQWISVYRKRIRADAPQSIRNILDRSVSQLCEPNIAEQQHIRCNISNREAGCGLLPQRAVAA